jgi:hypothetical protein
MKVPLHNETPLHTGMDKFHLAILVKPPAQDVMSYTEKVRALTADDERTILTDKCIKQM